MESLLCREAKTSDHLGIIELSKGNYGGADPTVSMFQQWIADPNCHPYVAETVSGQLVSFMALVVIDSGRSVVGRSGRVSQPFRKTGIMTMLNNYALMSVKTKFPQVNSYLAMYPVEKAISFNWNEKLKMSAIDIKCNVCISVLYVDSYIHRDIGQSFRAVYADMGKHKVAFTTFNEMYNRDESLRAIFPDNIITVGGDIMHANISETRLHLDGKEELKFLFTKSHENDERVSSVFSIFDLSAKKKNEVGSLVFELNLIGNDASMLKYHILESINSAMQVSKQVSKQIFEMILFISSPIDGGVELDVADFIRQEDCGKITCFFQILEQIVEIGLGLHIHKSSL